MTEIIQLADFKPPQHVLSEQLSLLLTTLHDLAPAYGITEVRLTTPPAMRTVDGKVLTAAGRDVSVLRKMDGDLKRSHHDVGNNLMVSQQKGTFNIMTDHGGLHRQFMLRLSPVPGTGKGNVSKPIDAFVEDFTSHFMDITRPSTQPKAVDPLRQIYEFMEKLLPPDRPSMKNIALDQNPALG